MAQLPCIGLCKPCISLPFGDCAMYFDHGVLALLHALIIQLPAVCCGLVCQHRVTFKYQDLRPEVGFFGIVFCYKGDLLALTTHSEVVSLYFKVKIDGTDTRR